jgi:hypothetical protein
MSPYVTVLAALVLALLSTNTLAEEKCTVGTLKGQYVFSGRGFIEATEPGVQRMHYGFFNFDGSGKLTGKQSSSRGGKIGREELEGTYTLESDCSGTVSFSFVGNPQSETHWDVYVTSDGRKGQMIRMDEGNMAVRSFEKEQIPPRLPNQLAFTLILFAMLFVLLILLGTCATIPRA